MQIAIAALVAALIEHNQIDLSCADAESEYSLTIHPSREVLRMGGTVAPLDPRYETEQESSLPD